MLERFKSYLREREFLPDEIEAVLSQNPTRLDQVPPRLSALQKFRELPEAEALAAADKRIRNILRQADGAIPVEVNDALLQEGAERELAGAVRLLRGEVTPLLAGGDYTATLKRLASLRPAVDAFFDKVLVMAEDPRLRANRLALLSALSGLFVQVADISRLQS
jgi:glycyl-tRNA synthetase beta chain